MSMLDDNVINPIERYLDLAAKRQELVVSNMANVDTPGYRTHDIDFKAELQRAAAGLDPDPQPKVFAVPGLIERPDGNNVSMDREGLLLGQTQLQFKMGAELLKHEFQDLMDVIKGGNSGS